MKILHRYILGQLARNLLLSLVGFTFLFLVFDFFDRIDNIVAEDASFWTGVQYFVFKIPLTLTLMLPVAMLVSTMLTIGLLSKNSEITAMRASGVTVMWLARPVLAVGLGVSLLALLVNETLVPYATRRVKEIYNIDIRQKDKRGGYSQSDIWWRSGNRFFSVGMFDSRTNQMLELSEFKLDENFVITRRIDAAKTSWLNPTLGWSMRGVTDYRFGANDVPEITRHPVLPLPLTDRPEDFYDVKTEPQTMSYRQLRRFIKQQARNGISITGYLADLHGKIAFPFISLIVTLIALPFALKPARSGSLAGSFVAGLIIGFSYYAVDSFSIAMGRAELWSPILAAWTANFLMGFVGLVLNLGTEAP
jgi:lipopolysaccharide export system permease protein